MNHVLVLKGQYTAVRRKSRTGNQKCTSEINKYMQRQIKIYKPQPDLGFLHFNEAIIRFAKRLSFFYLIIEVIIITIIHLFVSRLSYNKFSSKCITTRRLRHRHKKDLKSMLKTIRLVGKIKKKNMEEKGQIDLIYIHF